MATTLPCRSIPQAVVMLRRRHTRAMEHVLTPIISALQRQWLSSAYKRATEEVVHGVNLSRMAQTLKEKGDNGQKFPMSLPQVE
jgi:hypothetical protein